MSERENNKDTTVQITGGVKGWRSAEIELQAEASEVIQSIDVNSLSFEFKTLELDHLFNDLVLIQKLSSVVEQAPSFKIKSSDKQLRKAKAVVEQASGFMSLETLEEEETVERIMDFCLSSGFKVENLRVALDQATAITQAKIHFSDLEAFVNGEVDQMKPEVVDSLKKKEEFIKGFVSNYNSWFQEPLTQIKDQELEKVLDELRELGLDLESAQRVEALNTIRDLLYSIVNEADQPKAGVDQNIFEQIRALNGVEAVKAYSDKDLKNLKSQYDVILESVQVAKIENSEFSEILNIVGEFVWRVDARNHYTKKRPNKKTMKNILGDAPFSVIKSKPEEFVQLLKQCKLPQFGEDENVKELIVAQLSLEKIEEKHFFELLYKVIASDLSLELITIASLLGDYEEELRKVIFGKNEKLLKGLEDNELVDTAAYKCIRNRNLYLSNIEELKQLRTKPAWTPVKLNTFDQIESNVSEESLRSFLPLTEVFSNFSVKYHNKEVTYAKEKLETLEGLTEKVVAFEGEQVQAILKKENIEENINAYSPLLEQIAQNQVAFDSKTNTAVFEAISKIETVIRVGNLVAQDKLTEAVSEDLTFINTTYGEVSLTNTECEVNNAMDEEVAPKPTEENMEEETIEIVEKMVEEKENIVEIPEGEKITFEEAKKLAAENKKPSTYKGSVKHFAHMVEVYGKNLVELQDLQNEPVYDMIKRRVDFLEKTPIDFGEDFVKSKALVAKACEFIHRIFKIRASEVPKQYEQIVSDYEKLGIQIEEIKRFQEDYKRDSETNDKIQEVLKGEMKKLSFKKIYALKNLQRAARFFKSEESRLKLTDIQVMALIQAYKEQEKLSTQAVIDYSELKRIYIAIKLDKGKKVHIKPDNAKFIIKLFERTRLYIKKNIQNLEFQELQTKNLSSTYKNFVDLTGQIWEHKKNIANGACVDNKKSTKKRSALKPSGKKSIIGGRIEYSVTTGSGDELLFCKPSFSNKITEKHKTYYVNTFTYYMRTNPSFFANDKKTIKISKLEAFKLAYGLEKSICKKFYKDTLLYEKAGDRVISTLKKLHSYKYISRKLKDLRFQLSKILELRKASPKRFNELNQTFKKKAIQKIHQKKQLISGKTNNLRKRNQPGVASTENADDLELKTSSLIPSNHKNYLTFDGELKISSDDNKVKIFSGTKMISFDTDSNIVQSTQIPDNILLSDKVSYSQFQKYISGIFDQCKEFKQKFYIHQGWLNSNKSTIQLKSILSNKKRVASIQYSKRCKIFVFPKSALVSEWLEKRDFWCNTPSVDLFYLTIVKRKVNNFETATVPRPFFKRNLMMFKLFSKHHVLERAVYKPKMKVPRKNVTFRGGNFDRNTFTRKPKTSANIWYNPNKGRMARDIFNNAQKAKKMGKKENLFRDLLMSSDFKHRKGISASRPAERSRLHQGKKQGLGQLFHQYDRANPLKKTEDYKNNLINYLNIPSSLTNRRVAGSTPGERVMKQKRLNNQRIQAFNQRIEINQNPTILGQLQNTTRYMNERPAKTLRNKRNFKPYNKTFNKPNNNKHMRYSRRPEKRHAKFRRSNSLERSQSFERNQAQGRIHWKAPKADLNYSERYPSFQKSSLENAIKMLRSGPGHMHPHADRLMVPLSLGRFSAFDHSLNSSFGY